ncbi:hypothetical protein NDU88_002965 [Pleurodeles waltl]|uniref:Uncharacterized protein n=1 Tax=Pleurodeles waltl TaxID=8319 RepID=A0AAV7UET0_PLEWA|nr:hypothetical protein NDU88_002965 [Pleurodeles waltl]
MALGGGWCGVVGPMCWARSAQENTLSVIGYLDLGGGRIERSPVLRPGVVDGLGNETHELLMDWGWPQEHGGASLRDNR